MSKDSSMTKERERERKANEKKIEQKRDMETGPRGRKKGKATREREKKKESNVAQPNMIRSVIGKDPFPTEFYSQGKKKKNKSTKMFE